MIRYKLEIAYCGRNYAGSQIQLNKEKTEETMPTIQGELEKTLCTLIGVINPNEKRIIRTIFSGRTDKGVNALQQVVHFDFDKVFVASKFIKSMNSLLPSDISISSLEKVSTDFHAQKSVKQRHYRYEFVNRDIKNAFDGDLLRVAKEVDIERMQNALNYLVGEHDFSAFKNSRSENPNTICNLTRANCKRENNLIILELSANRFIYNMVRNIVGTLLMIEEKELPPEKMKEIMDSKDRSNAGKKVNPYGLTLMKIDY